MPVGARLDTDNNKALFNSPINSTRQYHAGNTGDIGEVDLMEQDSITTYKS